MRIHAANRIMSRYPTTWAGMSDFERARAIELELHCSWSANNYILGLLRAS